MAVPNHLEDWSPLDNRVLTHWQDHLPALAKDLQAQGAGKLEEAVHQAVTRALEQEDLLVRQGLDREQAWELVQQELFPAPQPQALEGQSPV